MFFTNFSKSLCFGSFNSNTLTSCASTWYASTNKIRVIYKYRVPLARSFTRYYSMMALNSRAISLDLKNICQTRLEKFTGFKHDLQIVYLGESARSFCSNKNIDDKKTKSTPVSVINRGRKRFFKHACVVDVDMLPDSNRCKQFTVALDNRPIKTPCGVQLTVNTKTLAQAVANEWDMQDDYIVPATMPLTTLSCTAIDRINSFGKHSDRVELAGKNEIVVSKFVFVCWLDTLTFWLML